MDLEDSEVALFKKKDQRRNRKLGKDHRDAQKQPTHNNVPRQIKPEAAATTANPSQGSTITVATIKPKSVAERKFVKRALVSNHTKYDEDPHINADDNEQLSADDFGKLLNVPVARAVDTYFFFNSEKNWQTDGETTPQYFNLNLQQLTRNLESIPFYIRHNYPRDSFTEREIEDWDQKAKQAYRKKRNEFGETKKIDVIPSGQQRRIEKLAETPAVQQLQKLSLETVKTDEMELVTVTELTKSETPRTQDKIPLNANPTESDDELDDILNFQKQPAVRVEFNRQVDLLVEDKIEIDKEPMAATVVPTIADTKEDIQQWLDDILED